MYFLLDDDCSGSAAYTEEISDFRCCESCANDECEIASVRALVYDRSPALDCSTDIEFTFDIEALVFDGCYDAGDGSSFISEGGDGYWLVEFYASSDCSGSTFVSLHFEDGDCDYYDQYNTTLNVNISLGDGSDGGGRAGG